MSDTSAPRRLCDLGVQPVHREDRVEGGVKRLNSERRHHDVVGAAGRGVFGGTSSRNLLTNTYEGDAAVGAQHRVAHCCYKLAARDAVAGCWRGAQPYALLICRERGAVPLFACGPLVFLVFSC